MTFESEDTRLAYHLLPTELQVSLSELEDVAKRLGKFLFIKQDGEDFHLVLTSKPQLCAIEHLENPNR